MAEAVFAISGRVAEVQAPLHDRVECGIGLCVVTVWAPQTRNCLISQWLRLLVW
jgi:hypothetical protein